MYRRLGVCLLLVFLGFSGVVFGQNQEELTITTYYPSPYGVYKEFTTTDNTYLATTAGRVGVGTTTPTAGFKMDVIGRLRCQTLTQYSSKDYKKDIQALAASDYQDILRQLNQTPVVRFRFKEEAKDSRLRIGLLAEEAPEEIVSDDQKGINVDEAIGFLAAAVKAQQEEISILKKEINRLKIK